MSRFTTVFRKLLFIFPLFVIAPIVIIIAFFNKPLLIFPVDEFKDRINSYIDSEMDGNSDLINFDILYNKIIFTYMLKKSRVASYAGISFDVSLSDISSYDFMELQAVINLPAKYLLTLITFIEGESRLSELDSMVYFNYEIDMKETKQFYKIDLNTFTTIKYDKMEKKKGIVSGSTKPQNVLFIHFKELVSGDDSEENSRSFDKAKTIIIERISFRRSYLLYYSILIISTLLYYALCLYFIVFRKKEKQVCDPGMSRDLPSIKLDVRTYKEEDIKKIMTVFRENVFEPEFSIHMVYKMTGLSQLRISRLIKATFKLSFKQLLNSIRLNEAKRLLLESDLKIYDIAFKIGYNNNAYFCTLFKNEFKVAPLVYRTQNKGYD